MDESFCFDNVVESDAYEHPFYPNFDDEESAALFRAFANEAWEGLGPDCTLGEQSTPSTCLPEQPSEEASVAYPTPSPTQSDSHASSTSKRVTAPVSANMMTGTRELSPPTPPTPVIPTPSDAPAPSPLPGIVSLPPTLSVDIAEASFAFANVAPESAQMAQSLGAGHTPSPPGTAYTSQSFSGYMTQDPTYSWSGAAPIPQGYLAQTMPGPFYPWNIMAMAPVAQPYPSQPWPAPVQVGNATASASPAQRYPMHTVPASVSATSSAISALPSNKRTFDFANPVMPAGFVANPNNHGRFQYVDGQRIYLNGPKPKRMRTGANQGT